MKPPGPSSLILYFVADHPSAHHNRDLFVWAASPKEAEDHWQKNYETTDRPAWIPPVSLTFRSSTEMLADWSTTFTGKTSSASRPANLKKS